MQRAGLGRDGGSVGAEVAMEYLQRLSRRRGARDHEGVVIARNGEDRSRIVSERVVKLIVIVLRLAKIVDDVAEMEDERSEEHTSELQSLRHLVCRLLLE